jgi:hypothetical protein
MRKSIFFLLFLSSFYGYSQVQWRDVYYIKYDKRIAEFKESLITIGARDSLDSGGDSSKMQWSFKGFERGKMLWECLGYVKKKDSTTLELYVEDFNTIVPKWKRQFERKHKIVLPYYELSKEAGVYFISNTQGRKKRKLQLIKK